MRKLLFAPITAFACLFTIAPVCADPPEAPPSEVKPEVQFDAEKVKVVVENFQKTLAQIQERVESIDKAEAYKEWAAIDTRTQQIVKFGDLTDLQKDVLYIIQAEQVEQMADQQAASLEAGFKFVAGLDDGETKKQFAKAIEPLKKVQSELASVRTKLAEKRVDMIDKAMEKHKADETLVAELKKYKDIVVQYNKDKDLVPHVPQEAK